MTISKIFDKINCFFFSENKKTHKFLKVVSNKDFNVGFFLIFLKVVSNETFNVAFFIWKWLVIKMSIYFRRDTMVPSFMSGNQVMQILATGKSLNFLRSVCKVKESIDQQESVAQALQATTGKGNSLQNEMFQQN